MTHQVDEIRAYEAVVRAIHRVLDVEVESLRPDTQVADLDLDSMDAADIVGEVQKELDADIDARLVLPDWSPLTLAALGAELVRCTVSEPGPS